MGVDFTETGMNSRKQVLEWIRSLEALTQLFKARLSESWVNVNFDSSLITNK